MSVWSVYVVRCVDGSFYVGISTDVRARVVAHNRAADFPETASR